MHPQTKGLFQDRVEGPPARALPSPSFGDLNANKAAARGAWRSRGWRTPPIGSGAGRGLGGGTRGRLADKFAPALPLTHPQTSLWPLLPAPVAPRSALLGTCWPRAATPPPQLSGRWKPGQPDMVLEGAGLRHCAPRLVRPHGCRAESSGPEPGFLAPAGKAGREARGRQIRPHNPGPSPSPPQTFRGGEGKRRSSGTRGGSGHRPDSTGIPALLSPVPQDHSDPPSTPGYCPANRSEPPARGAARTQGAPLSAPLPLPAPPDPAPRARRGRCLARGDKAAAFPESRGSGFTHLRLAA